MAEKEKKLIPEIRESAKQELRHNSFATVHKPGHYLIEQPDGVLINVTPRVYDKAFKDKAGFTVKKSPNA